MAAHLAFLIAQYGLLLVFFSVLIEQAGLPVPAYPVLVVAGALAAGARLPLAGIVVVALAGSLVADVMWYWVGRHFGTRMMRMLCRISLSPDSCVHRSELHFERWRGRSLLVAKFVPGLSIIAPPLTGALGLSLRDFMLFDGLGALAWVAAGVGLGYVFAAQVDHVLVILSQSGMLALEVVLGLLVIYMLARWWRRRRTHAALQMPRITVAELARAIDEHRAPVIIDVRSATSRLLDPRIIRGARPADAEHVGRIVNGVPRDRQLVVYCNCPDEATSARAAKALLAEGYRDVRPLLGGLAAWTAAGHAVQALPPDAAMMTGRARARG